MCKAIHQSKDWKSGNTEVYNNENNASLVFLHGNLIATITDDDVMLFDGGWRTTTTKSRLNAILSEFGDDNTRVYQKNFQWILSKDKQETAFISGMKLSWLD